ncbi:MAG: Phospho-N-acetylmuramoyl-pentapeptide- transferase [Candidatus Methanogaster sp.]|nr:MAG: Phospho-N-acetylmuramoyl-pentapeptide- transferase [ANME-2 cluster archaeon]
MNISYDVQNIIIFTLLSFLLTAVALPETIRILKSSGMVVKDYYKAGEVCVPTNGGLLIGLVVLVLLSASVICCNSTINFIIVYIAVMYAIFGILDDHLRIRNRWLKIFFPYFFLYLCVVRAVLNSFRFRRIPTPRCRLHTRAIEGLQSHVQTHTKTRS